MRDLQREGQVVADAMVRFPKTFGTGATLEDLRVLFEDEHVHMALIVADDGRLLTTVERGDLTGLPPGPGTAREAGTLTGRTAAPADSLAAVTAELLRAGRRRLAVVDGSGLLLGLLCLKRDGTGYCSDEGIRQRALDRSSRPVTSA